MAKFTLVQDSSQISLFLECPQKWLYYYIKGLQPTAIPEETNEAMNSGSYGHRLLEIYYRARTRGCSVNDSIEAFNNYDPDRDTCECGCPKDLHCPIPELGIEECRKCKKCALFRPKVFNLDSDVRKKVLKRVREYAAKYANSDDIKPTSEQTVEVGFSEAIHEDSENLFVLEGRIDILGKLQGLDCFMDHKFQGQTHWLYMKSVQFKNYALVTKTPMGVVNYIRLAAKAKEDTLTRDIVTFNSVEIEAWHKRLIQVYQRMKHALQKGPDRNWNACSGYMLTFDKTRPNYCWYTDLCESIDPRIQEQKEKTLYRIREQVWRPW